MTTFKKILFPVDLSEMSDELVPLVREMAERFNAQVHVIFCARVYEHFVGMYVPHASINNFEAEIVRGAEQKLNEFVADHMTDLHCTHKVISGDPSDTILRYAEDNQIDLIMMGSHGRKGMERVLFGSVAERVVKYSPVPVLVIKPGE